MKDRSSLRLIAVLSVSIAAFGQQGVVPPTPEPAPDSQTVATDHSPVSAAPANVSAAYILGADDVILVTVWKEPALSGPLSIRPDGMISLPLVGDVRAEGMTPMALGGTLTERLKKFISNPTVTVTVTGVNSKRIYLVGELQRVGPLPLSEGLTVVQAIASAGGLTPYANAKHIYILRGSSGRQRKIPFNYKKAIKDGDLQGVTLTPGDTIVVP